MRNQVHILHLQATVMGTGPFIVPPITLHLTILPSNKETSVIVVRVDVAIPPSIPVKAAWNKNPVIPILRVGSVFSTIPDASLKPDLGGGVTIQRTSTLGSVQVKITLSSSGQATLGLDTRVAM